MKPIDFKESNAVLKAPDGSEQWCRDLHCWKGLNPSEQPTVISVWEPSIEELSYLIENRKIYLRFECAETHPPVSISVVSPFTE